MKNSFNPDEMTILTKVVDEACVKLGPMDDATKEGLALRVLDQAAKGERDPDELLSFALCSLGRANAA